MGVTVRWAPQVRALLPQPWRARLAREVGRMAKAAARQAGRPDYAVGLTLTDDATIHQLNRDYRGKDKPTDVLAFAQREGPGAGLAPEALADELGDVIISVPTARRQAKRRGPAGLFAELRHLAAHGLCHTLGYDHRDDAEEATMNARAAALIAEGARRGRVAAA